MKRATRLRVLFSALLAVLAGGAPSVAQVTVVRAGRLIDGTGGKPLSNVVIVVENGRIREIGTGVAVPPGAEVIDLSDTTVLPGFIDCHVHLTGRWIGEGLDWQNARVRDLPQKDAIRGVRNAWMTLAAGFTTVRNVGAQDLSDIALRDMIRDGVVPGPRVLTAGNAIGITGGHCDTNGYVPGVLDPKPGDGIADGIPEILREVRLQVKRGADVIKFCATGGVLSERDAAGVQQYTDEEMQALVAEAHLTGRKVAAHAHGTEGIKAALEAGVDSIEHGSMLDDEAIALFKKKGAYLVPTLMAQETVEAKARDGILTGERADKARYVAPRARASFRKAAAAGVKIALGTDAGVYPHGNNGREFVLMVDNGMSPMQAIVAGTSSAARLLGLEAEVGTVERGKTADLVAVPGDPLQDVSLLTRPVFVMHEGKVVLGK